MYRHETFEEVKKDTSVGENTVNTLLDLFDNNENKTVEISPIMYDPDDYHAMWSVIEKIDGKHVKTHTITLERNKNID